MEAYDRDSISAELRRIAELLGRPSVTATEIQKHGRVSASLVVRRFGSMKAALNAAGLTPPRRWTNGELVKMLADLWGKTLTDLERSPRMDDLEAYGVPVSWKVYKNRFGGWKKALLAASRVTDSGEIPPIDFPPRRAHVSQRTRFFVFQRDSYTCCICKEAGGKLEIDHIVPHGLGGSGDIDNLQTLCRPCNIGKGKNMQ